MKAKKILNRAAELVGGDRNDTHGDMIETHCNIAELWQAYLRVKAPGQLNALDVANMMELLKIARRCGGTLNVDDYVDGAGYAAVAGEIAGAMNG